LRRVVTAKFDAGSDPEDARLARQRRDALPADGNSLVDQLGVHPRHPQLSPKRSWIARIRAVITASVTERFDGSTTARRRSRSPTLQATDNSSRS
jgi:hypothetical protein